MRKKNIFGNSNLVDVKFILNDIIKGVAKKRKQVVYGARSIQAQSPLFARDTSDWDIFDKNPQKVAKLVEKMLDKKMKTDYFYTKPAEHEGTWKVKGKGFDGKKDTEDDESIADYTKPTEKVKFVIRNGVRYRVLKEELKRKQATVSDPEFKFRHEKDRDDIKRIKGYLKVKRIVGGRI